MNAVAATRRRAMNCIEGMALIALFQALPIFSGAALLLRLFGSDARGMVGGAVVYVVLCSFDYTRLAARFGPRLSAGIRRVHEPLFFDPALSFPEKITRWRMQPFASQQLASIIVMLSLLATAVVLVGWHSKNAGVDQDAASWESVTLLVVG